MKLKHAAIMILIAIVLMVSSCDLINSVLYPNRIELEEAAAATQIRYIFPDNEDSVTTDIYLPFQVGKAILSWKSSSVRIQVPTVVTAGEYRCIVTRPSIGAPDITVTLTATYEIKTETLTKDFIVKVIANQ